MKNRVVKRILAGSLAAVVTISGVGVYQHETHNEVTTVQAEDVSEELKEQAEQLLESDEEADHTGEFYKEETVYVKADASGKTTSTTVSEWLQNPEKGSVEDVSSLSDISNIKGDETFKQEPDGTITWNSEGKDIYYQGTSNAELPVDISIAYSLDGKEIEPEDLAGKSGKLEMKITYKNNSKEETTVNGNNTTMYTPFSVASAMMLSTDEFQNVKIDNGKVISDADKDIVVGVAFPGLTENLNLQDLDIEIPESITITADVTEMSVPTTLTMVDSNILGSFDLDGIDSFDDLSGSLNELEDATNQLVDGSKQLAEGSKTLQDGVDAYTSGVSELASGSKQLYDGTGELVSGVNKATEGISQLKSGSDSLATGAASAKTGAAQIAGGLQQLDQSLKAGKTISASDISLGSEAQTQIASAASQMANAAANALPAEAFAAVDEANGYPEGTTKTAYISGLTSQYASALSQLAAQTAVSAAQTATTTTMNMIDQQIQPLVSGASSLSSGVNQLSSGANQLQAGLEQLNNNTGALVSGTNTVYENLGKIAEGAAKLNEKSSLLTTGTSQLTDGANALANGMSQYKSEGIDQLTNLFDGDITKVTSRIKAMKELGDSYTSFAGKDGKVNGSTRFIIETTGIDN